MLTGNIVHVVPGKLIDRSLSDSSCSFINPSSKSFKILKIETDCKVGCFFLFDYKMEMHREINTQFTAVNQNMRNHFLFDFLSHFLFADDRGDEGNMMDSQLA